MSIDIEDYEYPETPDYARANGSPMVMVGEKRIRMSRPSNYAKPLDDESALTNWRIDTAAFGVANSRELQARYVATKREDRPAVKALREAAIQAGRGEEAAAIGTAIHAMSVRFEQGDATFNPPEPYLSALRAYVLELERLGLESEFFEVALVNMEYKAAGTADRLYRLTRDLVVPTGEILPAGTLICGDLKTSKTLDYSMGAFACQISLYAQGEMYDVTNDVFLPTPTISPDWGVIAWIPSNQEQGHCEIIWVDLQAGNHAAWLAHLVKEHRKIWRQAKPIRVPDPISVEDVLVAEFGAEPLADTDDFVTFIKARMQAIARNAEAKADLAKHWPSDIPTPKQGLAQDHIERVLALLNDVEAEHGLGWPSGDPRSTAPHTKKVS